jgi:hypothetical protein
MARYSFGDVLLTVADRWELARRVGRWWALGCSTARAGYWPPWKPPARAFLMP